MFIHQHRHHHVCIMFLSCPPIAIFNLPIGVRDRGQGSKFWKTMEIWATLGKIKNIWADLPKKYVKIRLFHYNSP
jgi:hypothetical protein